MFVHIAKVSFEDETEMRLDMNPFVSPRHISGLRAGFHRCSAQGVMIYFMIFGILFVHSEKVNISGLYISRI